MEYSGAPNSLLNIACLLRKKGNYVKVGTIKPGPFEKEFLRRGFIVRHFDQKKYEYHLLSKKCDLVISNTVFCTDFALGAQKYVKTILYVREAHNLPQVLEMAEVSKEKFESVKNMLCVSEYAYNYITENYNVNELHIIHNFLNRRKTYTPTENSCNEKVSFLLAGTIEKRKGQKIAVDAFNKLNDTTNNIVLHLVGRVPEWCEEYFKSLELDKCKNVIYHGDIKDKNRMKELYESVNVVIVPSFDESCSLTALEGAMYGRALIVSENVGAKYIINGNGFIVKTGSVDSLADKIKWFADNNGYLSQYGKQSYKNFLKTSNSKLYYKNLCDIINQIKFVKELSV